MAVSDRSIEPGLLPVLPMLYVVWADGELSSEEVDRLCEQAHRLDGLDAAGHEALDRWLDPDRPPSAAELQHLLETIRDAAPEMGPEARTSLVDLGLELTRVLAPDRSRAASAATRDALRQVEEALGVVPGETSLELLTTDRPSAAEPPPAPTFPVASLTRLLDGRYGELRDRLRHLLATEPFRRPLGLDTEAYRARVRDWLERLASEGYGALSYPEEAGGEDDLGAFMAAFETLATHDLSLTVKFGVQFGLWGGSVLFLGDSEQQRRYLPDTGSAQLLGCFAMSETGHGSNVQELETRARFNPETGEFELHTPREAARKDYIGNAARDGSIATVFAQLEVEGQHHGVHALVVAIRDDHGQPLPGVTIGDCGLKLGLNGVDNGRLSFDRVRVPRRNLLGRFAQVTEEGVYESPITSPSRRFFTMLGTLVGGRISIAAAALSAAKAGLTIAVRYAERRRQFGPPGECEQLIMDYPSHQLRLLPPLATTFALDFAVKQVRDRFLNRKEEEQIGIEHLAAGVKAMATWHTISTLQTCRECCGGAGYLAENRFAELKADTAVFATFEGDNTVLLQLLAKGLLTGLRQQFSESRLRGLLRYLARGAVTVVSEMNPVTTRRTDREHLLDADFHRAALEYRERRLLSTAGQRLQRRLAAGVGSQQAFLDCQTHLLTLARAHVERVVFDAIRAVTDTADDPELEPILTPLRNLYAVSRLERHRGWFLEQDYFAGAKAKAIRTLLGELCAELRPHAGRLVDAFGIPDPLLAATIGLESTDATL